MANNNTKTVGVNSLGTINTVERGTVLLAVEGSSLKKVADRSVFVKRPPVADLNDATLTGYYCLNKNLVGQEGTIANLPDSSATYGILLVFEDDTSLDLEFVQVVVTVSAKPGIYVRKRGSSSGWSAWFSFSGTEIASKIWGG